MKKIIFFLFTVLASSQAFAGYFDSKAKFLTLKTEHFYIHYPQEVAPVAEDLKNMVEPIHDRLTEKFKWDPWGRTHIVLVDQTDQANGLATVIPSNYMLLYVTPPDAESSLDNYRNYLELLFTHEYTHIVHIDMHSKIADPFHWIFGKIVAPNGITPGWMREGIATWQESLMTGTGRANSSYAEMVLRTAVLENQFPKLDEVAGLGRKWPGGDSQYMFGVKFFQWLSDKYGEKKLVEYTQLYSSGLWLFSLNNKAKRVYGKTFYELWDQWHQELNKKYGDQKTNLEGVGLTHFEPLLQNQSRLSHYTPSPDGKSFAYFKESQDDYATIEIVTEGEKEPTQLKHALFGQMSWTPDSQKLAFAQLSSIEKSKTYSEIYLYDLKKKETKRIFEIPGKDPNSKIRTLQKIESNSDKTIDSKELQAAVKAGERISMRAVDPDFSRSENGRYLIMVRTQLGTDNLYLCDLKELKGWFITESPRYTQFSNPRFSPDGKTIVVSRKEHEGFRDIVLYSRDGTELSKITSDSASENYPVFSNEGRKVLYSSDYTGISNLYEVDIATHQARRLTNTTTGVFQPQESPDGKTIYARTYQADGYHLAKMSRDHAGNFEITSANLTPLASPPLLDLPSPAATNTQIPEAKKYSAFPQVLFPRYLMPSYAISDDSILLGVGIGRFDPLYRHAWNAWVDYRTDANFVGGGASYNYLRYNPSFFVGGVRYAYNWGNLFGTGNFFEERMQGYTGTSYQYGRQNFSLMYFYETRDALSTVPALPAGQSAPIFDQNAGLRFTYYYGSAKRFTNSISPEDGFSIKLTTELTDSALGSSDVNEQQVAMGDVRYYLELPWNDHHVLAVRAAGGWVWGDRDQIGGAFRFGGPFGEGTLAATSSRLFAFRGLPVVTFARDRVALLSTEYRLPLARVDRGIGTWPTFMRNLYVAFFTDVGDSWVRNDNTTFEDFFEDMLVSVGAELRGDFVIGYGLPLSARLGYGIVVVNRDRIANLGLEDSLLGMDAKNGNIYFQFGTSF